MGVGFLKRNALWALLVLLLVGGALWMQSRRPEAQVVQARNQEMAEILAVSGQVRGRLESRLAPEITGTIGTIDVEEGQLVEPGQILAQLKSDRQQAQVDQASQRVEVAVAQLQVARRGPLPSELRQAQAEVQRSEGVSRANLASARERLLELERGPRLEQIEQSKAEQRQAQTELAQRKRDFQRQAELYKQGAISKQSYEQALTALQQSESALTRAQQRLSEQSNGTRPEKKAQARESVRAAEAELAGAQKAGRARIQQLRDRPRPEDIALAQAQVEEAQTALNIAKEQLAQTTIKAPYRGTVGRKLLRVGDTAAPNSPIFTFSSHRSLEIRVEIDESERARVEKGMKGTVRANGYSETFEAKIAEFAAEIDSLKGTLEVRLFPVETPKWLLSGQTVDVNIILSPQKARLLIPLTSVILEGESASVLVLTGNTLERRLIEVSSPSKDGYLVLSGLNEEDWVILYPQSFSAGDSVRADRIEGT